MNNNILIEIKNLKPYHLYKFAEPSMSEYIFLFIGYEQKLAEYHQFKVLTKNGIQLYLQTNKMKYIEIE